MTLIELLLIALGLSMDAFAIAICKGLSMDKFNVKLAFITGGYFGFFQGAMPVIGYFAGKSFNNLVSSIDHWIVFLILATIGGKMIYESRQEESADPSFAFGVMLSLSIATSIDALAVGMSFAFLQVNIITSALLIGVLTFLIAFLGVGIGNAFGAKYKSKAEFLGGVTLILIGSKILLQHLGVFNF